MLAAISVALAGALMTGTHGEKPAFSRPSNANALRSYLLGSWKLQKLMLYKEGGVSGRFEGTCSFAALDHSNDLCYQESGTFSRKGSDNGVETRNALRYKFGLVNQHGDANLVDCYFDDGTGAELRFLHSLNVDTLEFEGIVEEEGYSGLYEIEAQGAFMTTWSVDGPRQTGQILSIYTRLDE